MAADNKSLGKFILDGIPPSPRGIPQIEVTFDIDANGILKVTARDKATGRMQHITITASSGLSDSEVEKMRQDAETHAEDDRRHKDLIEARNHADNTAYAAEKGLREFGDKISADLKSEIETKVTQLRAKAQGEDVSAIRAAADDLGQSIQKIGASVYQDPASGPQAPPPGGAAGPDVVDGEVKE
jgi:molecular chaperone DnaK